MIVRSLLAAAISIGLLATAANAVTVTNTDKTTHHLIYTPKGGKAEHVALAANHHRVFACKTGGTIALGKSTESCSAKTAKITIKAGKLVI